LKRRPVCFWWKEENPAKTPGENLEKNTQEDRTKTSKGRKESFFQEKQTKGTKKLTISTITHKRHG